MLNAARHTTNYIAEMNHIKIRSMKFSPYAMCIVHISWLCFAWRQSVCGEYWMHFTPRKRKSISCSNRFGMSKISLRGSLKSRMAFDKLVCSWSWFSFFDILEILSRATNPTLICISVCASCSRVSISFCCLVKKNRQFSVVTVCIPMSSQRCDRIVYATHFIGINLILFLVGRMNLSIFQGAWKQIIHELSCFSDFFFVAAVAGCCFFPSLARLDSNFNNAQNVTGNFCRFGWKFCYFAHKAYAWFAQHSRKHRLKLMNLLWYTHFRAKSALSVCVCFFFPCVVFFFVCRCCCYLSAGYFQYHGLKNVHRARIHCNLLMWKMLWKRWLARALDASVILFISMLLTF